MHVHELIWLAQVPPSEKCHSREQKAQNPNEVREGAALVNLAFLNAVDMDTVNYLFTGQVRVSESNDVDGVTPLNQRVSILQDPAIRLIERVCNHANSHCFISPKGKTAERTQIEYWQ
jgi:hypothetical protein